MIPSLLCCCSPAQQLSFLQNIPLRIMLRHLALFFLLSLTVTVCRAQTLTPSFECLFKISFLNKTIEVGYQSDTITVLENEKKEFHQKVRNAFLEIANENKKRFLILNSEKIQSTELLQILLKELKSRGHL